MAILRPRRGKKATAIAQNLVLEKGEIFFETPDAGTGTGAGKMKMGDGKTTYTNLPYFNEGISIGTTTGTAFDGKSGNDHVTNKSNPHGVTKSQVGLGNVENKSSATIRGEITKANVTTALGYTPPTTNTTYNNATTATAGLMSSADKIKIDNVLQKSGSQTMAPDSVINLPATGGIASGINLQSSDGYNTSIYPAEISTPAVITKRLSVDGELSAKKFKGNLEGSADYATKSNISFLVNDYENDDNVIPIGWNGASATAAETNYVAVYRNIVSPDADIEIKDMTFDSLKTKIDVSTNSYMTGTETGNKNTSWYMKYPNGIVIQGGQRLMHSGWLDFYFPVTMIDTNYTVVTGKHQSFAGVGRVDMKFKNYIRISQGAWGDDESGTPLYVMIVGRWK